MTERARSVHASAVKVGDHAVLIRGPSGAGKSRLAFDLILAGRSGQVPAAVLVGDDRVHLDTAGKQLWVRPAPELTGRIEIRGLGIRRCDFAAEAWWAWSWISRLRTRNGCRRRKRCQIRLNGVLLPRIPVGAGFSPLPLVVAALTTTESSSSGNHESDCLKGIGNHMWPSIATE